jgi:hypothetical protein
LAGQPDPFWRGFFGNPESGIIVRAWRDSGLFVSVSIEHQQVPLESRNWTARSGMLVDHALWTGHPPATTRVEPQVKKFPNTGASTTPGEDAASN